MRRRSAADVHTIPWALPLVALILIVAAWGYTRNIVLFRVPEDEGQYLYDAWRISQGEDPYRDFVTAQMPAFVYLGGLEQRLFGPTWVPLRLTSIAATLMAGMLVFALGWRLHSAPTGLLAMMTFLVSDQVYAVGRIWRSDPYMLLGVTAGLFWFTWAVTQQPPHRRAGGLVTAGLSYAVAVLFKLFGLLPVAGCIVYLLAEAWGRAQRHRPYGRALLRDLIAFLAPLALILLLTAGLFTAVQPDFLAQIVGHHLRQGSDTGLGSTFVKGVRLLMAFASYQWPFLALAGAGAVLLTRRHRPAASVLLAQLPPAVAFLLIKRDVATRYLIYLVPVLSIYWAVALIEVAQWASGRGRIALMAGALLAITLGGWSLWPYLERDARTVHRHTQLQPPVVAFLREHTAPGDVVVSDQQWLNFLAQRRSTRTAAAISEGAASSGQITGAILRQEIEATSARAVVLDFGASGQQLRAMSDFDAFYRFVQTSFALVHTFTDDEQVLEVYLRDDLLPVRPDIQFGTTLALTGLDLGETPFAAGEARRVTLRWQAFTLTGTGTPTGTGTSPKADLSYSLRLRDGNGLLWAQVDGPIQALRFREGAGGAPFDVSESTSAWASGQVALTAAELPLPADMPPGQFYLWLRVYDAATQLSLEGQTPAGERRPEVRLATVAVMASQDMVDPARFGMTETLNQRFDEVTLVGRSTLPEQVRPGDRFAVALWWRAEAKVDASFAVRLRLSDGSHGVLDTREAEMQSPRGPLRVGQIVRGQYPMLVAPEARSGDYALMLQVATGQDYSASYRLGTIRVVARPHAFELPSIPLTLSQETMGDVAKLVGYNVDRRGWRDGRLAVTLVWQKLTDLSLSERYKVFVQVLNRAGQLVAQSDAEPAQGQVPTTSWLHGEFITDTHVLQLAAPASGPLQLIAGMYDPDTGQRLPVYDKDGQIVGDHVVLDLEIGH